MMTSYGVAVLDRRVRLDQHVAEAAERCGLGGHDAQLEELVSRLPGGHVGEDGADRSEHVVQPEQDRG